MNGPMLALILFVLIVLIYYKYENYFLFIPKTISLFLTFTLLILPQYADALPNYLYYKTQLLNYNKTNISSKNYITKKNTENSKNL